MNIMQITLDNIKFSVPSKIWERGEEYYENDAVTDLKEIMPGEWSATVEGSEYYTVEVSLKGNVVESWECDCPYDHGDICKHVVAVLLAISDEVVSESIHCNAVSEKSDNIDCLSDISAITEKKVDVSFDDIMKLAKEDDLRAFVEAYALNDYQFKNVFVDYISQKYFRTEKKNTKQKDYAKEISKIFSDSIVRSKSRYYNYYDEIDWCTIAYKMQQVFEDAAVLLKNGDTINPANIALHFFESVSEFVDDTIYYDDDSQYEMHECCENAGDLLLDVMKNTSAEFTLKQDIFRKICKVLNDHRVNDYVDYNVEYLMFELGNYVQSPEDRLAMIDVKIKEREEKNYGVYQYVQMKIDYLKELNRNEEALEVENSYLHLSEIRKKRVEQLVDSERYNDALQMIDEGILIAKEKRHYGSEKRWLETKLSIYERIDDKKGMIEISRKLFIDGEGVWEYYEKLRKIVPSSDWKIFLAKMISELKYKRDVIANIYEKEKDYDELYKWIIISSDRIRHSIGYGFRMPKEYHPILLEIFASSIKEFAANTYNMSRENYRLIAQRLNEAKKMNGGEAVVKNIVTEFRIIYKRRPAMMDELSGL